MRLNVKSIHLQGEARCFMTFLSTYLHDKSFTLHLLLLSITPRKMCLIYAEESFE